MSVSLTGQVLGLLTIYAIAVPMPGPSFVLITKASVGLGRLAGVVAAIGTTTGVAVYAIATLLGLDALVTTLPWLVTSIQILGGVYLIYLGFMVFRAITSKTGRLVMGKVRHGDERSTLVRIFAKALLVSLGNPKMAAFFFSLFAPLVGPSYSAHERSFALGGVILIDLAYHQALANILASLSGTQPMKQAGRWIEALAATLMTAFGLRLLVEAARSR